MQNIWLGGFGACSNHHEKDMLINFIISKGLNVVDDYKKADLIIVTDTCLGTYNYYLSCLVNISDILLAKKRGTEVIVSGCLAKGLKCDLSPSHNDILSRVTLVKSEDLISYITKLLTGKVHPDSFDIPYSVHEHTIELTPVSGCLNQCSFCKIHYMNFALKSYPFEKVESLAHDINDFDYDFARISIQASNMSLYGIDLYGKPRTHEVIRALTSPDKIKFAYVGALINFYQELVDEIINNPKIKELFISIESGSPRVYELMNRPVSLDTLIRVIKYIKDHRPDIVIQTEFIAGFPTETIDDLKRTIDLAYELDIFPTVIWPYMDSKQIPSSRLKGHSSAYCKEAAFYVQERLNPLRSKQINRYLTGERYVLDKDDEAKLYDVMLINGMTEYNMFEQFDDEYNPGQIIKCGAVKSRKMLKNKKR